LLFDKDMRLLLVALCTILGCEGLGAVVA
jgi:hypothetical protein